MKIFTYNDNGENFDRMSIQSTSIKDVKDINQSLMSLHPSSVNIICHPIVNIDGLVNIIASSILSLATLQVLNISHIYILLQLFLQHKLPSRFFFFFFF